MNIPPETARAQGYHGIKGASHGVKGGRPKLDLTDDERIERRRKQQEAYRRRQGIPAKEVRPPKVRPTNWVQQYVDIWGKLPGQPLTPEEFAAREPLWNRRVEEQQRAEERQSLDAVSLQRAAERETQARLIRQEPQGWAPFPSPVAATPSVGRNQPCPCGSGRKFKKCCGP